MSDETSAGAVVVGCDGSWESLRAVRTATHEAQARAAALVLLSFARPRPAERLGDLREAESAALAEATATVKHAAELARATDRCVPVQAVVVGSWQDRALDELARRAVLLVLGSHGRGGQSAFSLGSASRELVRRLGVPVLVPGEQGRRPGVVEQARARVRVGYRPDVDAPDLLRLAAGEAALRQTGLEVVAAVGPTPREEVSRVQDAVWRTIDAVPACARIPLHVVVVDAPAVMALLLGARPGDLVVVGTRGGGTLAGLVPGSVARAVLDASASDVLVVPGSVRVERAPVERAPVERAPVERAPVEEGAVLLPLATP